MFSVMEFMTLPPEITSALIYSGPGAGSLIEASTEWQRLGTTLDESAESYAGALSKLTGTWQGPSSIAMTQAAERYLTWLRSTAQQCQQIASSAKAAAAAFNSVRAAVVPTSQVRANRTRLAQLLATNRFGSNLPAIADTEDQYHTMWANNSAAMSRYQTASAQATTLPQLTSPPSVTNPAGPAAQADAVPAATTSAASAASTSSTASALASVASFDPQSGWFGLANTYANQFISSGFPINLLSYLAQNSSAQALQGVSSQIGQGLSEGEAALGPAAGLGGLGAAGLSAEPTAAIGVGVSMGKLTAPPAVVGLLPASQAPVQLASAASPLPAGEPGLPVLPPIMPPPISAGSGWRKRKQQKYEDLEYGLELKGTVMQRPPSAG
jgi:PPE-repeat protein